MSVDVHPNVLTVLAGILGVLVTATLVVAVLGRIRPDKDRAEIRARIRSWWYMAGLFGLALVVERGWSLVFFGFLSYLALKEYLSLIPTRRADRRVLLWAYLAVPLQYLWIYMEWYGLFIIFVPVYLFLAMPMRMVLIGETEGFLRAAGTIHWGAMIAVFSIGHIAYLLVLPPSVNPNGAGPALVLFLVVLTQLNDVAQFMWGKALGRAKVMPTVSPNKTWGGLIGGIATTVGLAMLMYRFLTPFQAYEAAAAGLLIGVFGFVGDVVISALKRDLKVKDSGSLIPGHGGILDRLDSLTYTAPLFFHFTYYLYGA
ncbi:MAG: phosphatidate cytidylyltransferase [Gemmatimonadota bacterium]|nr:phosphatidate cytidylyltransferase [Gemmatimonadota bacterium]